MKHIALVLTLLCALFAPERALGQTFRPGEVPRPGMGMGQQPIVGSNPFDDPNAEQTEAPDTTPKRERKPLESYFFDDSVRNRSNFAWNVDMYTNNVHVNSIDTTLNDFEVDYTFLKHDVGDAYLGNLGAPTIPLAFHLRPEFRDFSMTQPVYSYVYTPENAPFYNVKKPFSQLSYFTAGQKRYSEESLSIIHAQNISPSTGFNATYRSLGTRGIYMNQRTRDQALSLGINHTGKRYSAHAGYIFNNVDMQENGGLFDDWHVTGTTAERPFSIAMALQGAARNYLRNNTFYTVHSYGIPLRRLSDDDFTMGETPAFYIGYSFQYDNWSRKYVDDRAMDAMSVVTDRDPEFHPPISEYYNNWYQNRQYSRDSTFESRLSNRVFVQLQPWDRNAIVGVVDAGVGMDIHKYSQFRPSDFLTGRLDGEALESYYVYGGIEGKLMEYFDWSGKLHITPLGYRQGDIKAEANAKLSVFLAGRPVSLSGRFGYSLQEPDYWQETYYSNHFRWNNSFDKENVTRLEVKLDAPHWRFEAGLHQSILGNRIYFSPRYGDVLATDGVEVVGRRVLDITPVQSPDVVSVTGVYGRKDFRLGGLNLNHRVMLQWSSDHSVAPVPMFSAYLSYFYEFDLVRDVLRIKAGVDGRFNTRYYAYGYNPSLGQFYNQREKEIGNYPMMNVFIAAKWKRMRILLQYSHVSEDLFDTREYFQVLHYPLNKAIFKIGVSWGFYD